MTSAVSDEATVAEAFLRMFVETCGHYDAYINTQQDGEKIFQVHTFRPHHMHIICGLLLKMSEVCLCVCMCVGHDREACKNG